jgi:2-iminobutanoate/2-iminopropanoate deaminase
MTPHLKPWISAGPIVYLSGQLAFDADRNISAPDIVSQTRQVLENIATVLRDADLSPSDVVKTTVWLRNGADFSGFDAAYASFFGQHRPARSTVVANLVLEEALVEIEAIAYRG